MTDRIRRLLVVLLVGAMALVAWPATAAPSGRAGQLERAAVDLAVRLRAVPVRDGGFSDPGRYCPPGRLVVSWRPPVGAFRFGGYRRRRPRPRPGRAHNRRIWGSYLAEEGWRSYVGANPHTDHVHFGFSWAGARKQTSYWDGSPVTYGAGT